MSVTTDTRRKSLERVDKKRLCDLIISTLFNNPEESLTAREIAVILYNQGYIKNNDRQATQPRLTELMDEKKVKVVGKKFDDITQRNVAAYALAR